METCYGRVSFAVHYFHRTALDVVKYEKFTNKAFTKEIDIFVVFDVETLFFGRIRIGTTGILKCESGLLLKHSFY